MLENSWILNVVSMILERSIFIIATILSFSAINAVKVDSFEQQQQQYQLQQQNQDVQQHPTLQQQILQQHHHELAQLLNTGNAASISFQTQTILHPAHPATINFRNAQHEQVVAGYAPTTSHRALAPAIQNEQHLQQHNQKPPVSSTAFQQQTWSAAPIVVDYVDFVNDDDGAVPDDDDVNRQQQQAAVQLTALQQHQKQQQQQQQQNHVQQLKSRAAQTFYDASSHDYHELPQSFYGRPGQLPRPAGTPRHLRRLSFPAEHSLGSGVRPELELPLTRPERQTAAPYAPHFERYVQKYPSRLAPIY